MNNEIRIDALLPQEMAARAETLGMRKAEMPFLKMFMLAVLAGAFIALGAVFSTTVAAGGISMTGPDGTVVSTASLPYGLTRMLGRACLLPGLDPGGGRRGGTVHRQQPDRHGLGQ